MSPTCLIVPLGEMAMNAIRSVTRVGLRMFSTTGAALLVLFGCPGDLSAVAMDEVVLADAPSVDASFLSALEWRFEVQRNRLNQVIEEELEPLLFR